MLSQAKCKQFYRILSDDLRTLARIGKDYNLFDGYHELENAATTLSLNKSPNWSYNIPRLTFSLSSGCIAWPVNAKNAHCIVSLSIAGKLTENSAGETVIGITGLECQIEFIATDKHDKEWYQYWHFDRHPGGNTPPEIHPLFHLNFGGKNMANCRARNSHDIFHRVIELQAPRIQLPPMDAPLLIDFIVSNFNGAKWADVSGVAAYLWVIENSQGRIWADYVGSLSGFFGSTKTLRASHEARQLWPSLAICPE